MDYPQIAPRQYTACCIEQALEFLRQRAMDGDTIRLQWNGVSSHAKTAIESAAAGLGLDIIVEITR